MCVCECVISTLAGRRERQSDTNAQMRVNASVGGGRGVEDVESERESVCTFFFFFFFMIPAYGDYRAEQLFLLHHTVRPQWYILYIYSMRALTPSRKWCFIGVSAYKQTLLSFFYATSSLRHPPWTLRIFFLFQSPNQLLAEYHTICSCAWKTSIPPMPPLPSADRMLIRWEKLHWAAQPTDLIRDDYTCGRTLPLQNFRPVSHKLLVALPLMLFLPSTHDVI